jgi:hypothetical protein
MPFLAKTDEGWGDGQQSEQVGEKPRREDVPRSGSDRQRGDDGCGYGRNGRAHDGGNQKRYQKVDVAKFERLQLSQFQNSKGRVDFEDIRKSEADIRGESAVREKIRDNVRKKRQGEDLVAAPGPPRENDRCKHYAVCGLDGRHAVAVLSERAG